MTLDRDEPGRAAARETSEPMAFTIGSEVSCSDGVCGELSRVVIDPVARVLAHLVVEPRHPHGSGHLVPVGLVDTAAVGIRLRCSRSEFDALEDAEEIHFLPGGGGPWGYGEDQVLSWPYYGLGMGGGMAIGTIRTGPQPMVYDRVPKGEVAVRRGARVHATDGDIGRVQGLVIDRRDDHVTHVLLDEGHLWGQKRVAIPINAVTGVSDGVRLSLTKDEIRDLPAADLDTAS
jgi:sporulation protein YlmC with PRC-barrel domain